MTHDSANNRLTGMENELVIAEHFYKTVRDVCFISGDSIHGWYFWDGKRWAKDPSDSLAVGRAASEFLKTLARTTGNQRLGSSRLRNTLVSEAKQNLVRSESSYDQDMCFLNTPSGTVDLRNGNVHDNDRNDMITKVTPIAYNPDADYSAWENFLLDSLEGDEDRLAYLKRWLGYAITGEQGDKSALHLFGVSNSGKSLIMRALERVLGTDYVRKVNESIVTNARSFRGAGYDRGSLKGIRIAYCSETEGVINADKYKDLTGGESYESTRLHVDAVTTTPTHHLILATNQEPEFDSVDDAVRRRVRAVQFNRSFNTDPMFEETIKACDEGILRWLIEGAVEYYRSGRVEVYDGHSELVDDITATEDTLDTFLTEGVAGVFYGNETFSVTSGDLLGAYQEWCKREKIKPEYTARTLKNAVLSKVPWVTFGRSMGKSVFRGMFLVADQ